MKKNSQFRYKNIVDIERIFTPFKLSPSISELIKNYIIYKQLNKKEDIILTALQQNENAIMYLPERIKLLIGNNPLYDYLKALWLKETIKSKLRNNNVIKTDKPTIKI